MAIFAYIKRWAGLALDFHVFYAFYFGLSEGLSFGEHLIYPPDSELPLFRGWGEVALKTCHLKTLLLSMVG